MSKKIEIQVEKDHLMALAKVNGVTALSELIWNSLDADSKNIQINSTGNEIFFDTITVKDDGHGMNLESAEKSFRSLGGSIKKEQLRSPESRVLHGREGKGRFRAFAIADLIRFDSVYFDNVRQEHKEFSIKLNKDNVKNAELSDEQIYQGQDGSGCCVTLQNLNQDLAAQVFSEKGKELLGEKYAVYSLTYPNFRISINGERLNFRKFLKRSTEYTFKKEINSGKNNSKKYVFSVKIIEWKKLKDKKSVFLCSKEGISFAEEILGVKSSGYNITVHLMSDYIEYLYSTNKLDIREANPDFADILETTRDFVKQYIEEQKLKKAKNYINLLKKDNLYPFINDEVNKVDTAIRKVFDILALQLNQNLSGFNSGNEANRRFSMSVIKNLLEKDPDLLREALLDNLQLPKESLDTIYQILDNPTLNSILKNNSELNQRIEIIEELSEIISEPNRDFADYELDEIYSIFVSNKWLFGDEFSFANENFMLSNLVKGYKELLEDNDKLVGTMEIQLPTYNLSDDRNMVVVIYNPSIEITETSLKSFKKYIKSLTTDESLQNENSRWQFLFLSAKLDEKANQSLSKNENQSGILVSKQNIVARVADINELLKELKLNFEARQKLLENNLTGHKSMSDFLDNLYKKYLSK